VSKCQRYMGNASMCQCVNDGMSLALHAGAILAAVPPAGAHTHKLIVTCLYGSDAHAQTLYVSCKNATQYLLAIHDCLCYITGAAGDSAAAASDAALHTVAPPTAARRGNRWDIAVAQNNAALAAAAPPMLALHAGALLAAVPPAGAHTHKRIATCLYGFDAHAQTLYVSCKNAT